jgi:hypothetical protein
MDQPYQESANQVPVQTSPYPSLLPIPLQVTTDDPKAAEDNASPAEHGAYLVQLLKYSDEALAAFKSSNVTGKRLWEDFNTAFTANSMRNLNTISVVAWRDFLVENGIFVADGRFQNRKESLIQCLMAEGFPVPPAHTERNTKILRNMTEGGRKGRI